MPYYRFKESYRDVRGVVHSLIVLNVGYAPDYTPREMHRIAKYLTERFKHRHEGHMPQIKTDSLTEKERAGAEAYWRRMIDEGMIDRFDGKEAEAAQEAERYVDIDTVEHSEVREVGAEWLCKQAVDELRIEEFLRKKGWSAARIHTALSHLIIRAVYGASEYASYRIMAENSAACELYSGCVGWMPGINSLYQTTDKLYEIKREIEDYISDRTDTLFNLSNNIILFDLTNFYFEGSKRDSKKEQYGRSKEKRTDCKLLVLSLAINADGFIRYSEILQGNTSDPRSLPDMVDKIYSRSPAGKDKTLVVMDAGIATEENLALIRGKGYNYLCVSRTKLKDYALSDDERKVIVTDSRKNEITLREVHREEGGDYYLEVTSPTKAMTEASMNRQWRERFEQEMEKINAAIGKKGGTKNYEKVIQRTGRAIEKYPSIAKYYDIEYVKSDTNPAQMDSIRWSIRDLSGMESGHGVYFLRTNIDKIDEKSTWKYYNLIREIECTNRQLKTDLNLRPIFHQKDDRSDAHIFFGLLAYQVVNTIRHRLKKKGITCYWTEIKRRMSTQKLVTTRAVNALGGNVELRQCSRPAASAVQIYDALGYRHHPFKKIKICRTQKPPDKPLTDCTANTTVFRK